MLVTSSLMLLSLLSMSLMLLSFLSITFILKPSLRLISEPDRMITPAPIPLLMGVLAGPAAMKE